MKPGNKVCKYLLCCLLGIIQSIGITGVIHHIFHALPVFHTAVIFAFIAATAALVSYYFMFTVLPELMSVLRKQVFAVSLTCVALLSIMAFMQIPLYEQLSATIIIRAAESVGLILFIAAILTSAFLVLLTGRITIMQTGKNLTTQTGGTITTQASGISNQSPCNLIESRRSESIIIFVASFLGFFGICILYLLAYYPGVMSGDSFTQWSQMESLNFNDWHPAFSTLLNWVVTRVWHAPSAIAVFDSFLFALVFAAVMVELKKLNTGKVIFYMTAAVIALNPVNGIMSITLWKDIPYSVSILWLTLLSVKICRSRGYWLKSWLNTAVLALTLVFCALIRHNGMIPVILLVVLIPFLYWKYWKQWAVSATFALILILVIKGPGYDKLGVTPAHPFQSLVNPIMQVGGIVTGGGILTDEEKKLVNEILPLEKWKSSYTKYSEVPLASAQGFNMSIFKTKKQEFLKAWLHMAVRNPKLAVKAYLDRTAIIWRITDPPNISTFTNARNITNNDMGFEMKTRLSLFKNMIDQLLITMNKNYLMWLFWKPATYMLILLLAVVAIIAGRGFRWILLLVPVVGNTLGLLIVTTSNQTRYYYATLIIAPLIFAAAFCSLEHADSEMAAETNKNNSIPASGKTGYTAQ